MLNQLIVTSVAAGARWPGAARRIALAKPPQFHIMNNVTLRGFLGSDAESPSSDHIKADSFAVLLLATVSGMWDLGANEWNPRTDWHRIICPGPFFCGMVRGMRRGDYLEIEGELRAQQQERSVVVAGERFPMKHGSYAVHATRITRLDRPDALVDFGEDG